jgi:predicted transposase/invertase (TIGR01784 family)
MPDLTQPHDHFIKDILSRPGAARDFVQNYLPPEVVALLDLDSLDPTKDSFVDAELRSHYSDLLFTVSLKNRRPAFLYLLFEHKSYSDPDVGFQLLRYSVRIWEQYRRRETQGLLPPILPLVLYHGKSRWEVSTRFRDLVASPPELLRYIPDFEHHLCDLTAYSDEEIRGAVTLRAALLLMKHIFDPDLLDRLPAVLGLLRELARGRTGLETIETFLRYLVSASDAIDAEGLHHALEASLPGTGETLMPTLAEKWYEDGRQEGRQEGHTEGEAALLIRQLERKFGPLAAEHRARIDAADAETLLRWGERLLSAETIDDVFRD